MHARCSVLRKGGVVRERDLDGRLMNTNSFSSKLSYVMGYHSGFKLVAIAWAFLLCF